MLSALWINCSCYCAHIYLGLGCSLLVQHSLRIVYQPSQFSLSVTWVPGLPGRCNHVMHLRSHSSTCVRAQFSTEKVRVSWDLAESYTQCCLCSNETLLFMHTKQMHNYTVYLVSEWLLMAQSKFSGVQASMSLLYCIFYMLSLLTYLLGFQL